MFYLSHCKDFWNYCGKKANAHLLLLVWPFVVFTVGKTHNTFYCAVGGDVQLWLGCRRYITVTISQLCARIEIGREKKTLKNNAHDKQRHLDMQMTFRDAALQYIVYTIYYKCRSRQRKGKKNKQSVLPRSPGTHDGTCEPPPRTTLSWVNTVFVQHWSCFLQ